MKLHELPTPQLKPDAPANVRAAVEEIPKNTMAIYRTVKILAAQHLRECKNKACGITTGLDVWVTGETYEPPFFEMLWAGRHEFDTQLPVTPSQLPDFHDDDVLLYLVHAVVLTKTMTSMLIEQRDDRAQA